MSGCNQLAHNSKIAIKQSSGGGSVTLLNTQHNPKNSRTLQQVSHGGTIPGDTRWHLVAGS